jgi:guanylate kinase
MSNFIALSGPSGSGKTTLIGMLLKEHPGLLFSVSCTTRAPRKNEQEGREYYFITEEEFIKKRDNHEFVEWARVHSHYYGTTFEEIVNKLKTGRTIMVDIDIQGAKILKSKYPEAWYVLIVPPSLEILRQRLLGREKKMDSGIKKRLEIAKAELKQFNMYNYTIINDNLDNAFYILNAIYTAFQNSTAKKGATIKKLLET